jgi:hypothetical protein
MLVMLAEMIMSRCLSGVVVAERDSERESGAEAICRKQVGKRDEI